MRAMGARSRSPGGVVMSMVSTKAARLSRLQHRRLATFDDVLRAAHGNGGIGRHDLAGHKPVEQVVERREPLLDGRRGQHARLRLDPGGDVQGCHGAVDGTPAVWVVVVMAILLLA
jgi:hypothetical protein